VLERDHQPPALTRTGTGAERVACARAQERREWDGGTRRAYGRPRRGGAGAGLRIALGRRFGRRLCVPFLDD